MSDELDSAGLAPLLGKTLADGKYAITDLLGSGGMGTVYCGRHVPLDRTVAIKVLHLDVMRRSDALARFEREARAASRLGHRNSVQILDYGTEVVDGIRYSYIVMEHLGGQTLADLVRRHGTLDETRIIALMAQVCGALAQAHDATIVHRDMKPENIMVVEERNDEGHCVEVVKVLDFGLAKIQSMGDSDEPTLTKEGEVFGTPHYMSPEQVRGLPLDARSDLYSCGVILYHMACGRPPFRAESPIGVLMQHVADPPLAPRSVHEAVSAPLEEVILRALAKAPADRFQSARELRAALLAVGTATGHPVAPGTVPDSALAPVPEFYGSDAHTVRTTPPGRPRRRSFALLAVVALALAALLVGVAVWPSSGDDDGVATSADSAPPSAEPVAIAAAPEDTSATSERTTAAGTPVGGAPVAPAPDVGVPRDVSAPPLDVPRAPAPDVPAPDVSKTPGAADAGAALDAAPDTGTPEPSPTAVATAQDPVREPPVRPRPKRDRKRRPDPRVATTTPEPAPTPKPEAESVAAMEPASAPTPEPAPESAPEPAVAAPKPVPEPTPEPRAAVAPKPKPALDAKVSVRGVAVDGSLPTSVVRRAIDRVKGDFRPCYRTAARAAGRDGIGSARVKLVINVDGRASDVAVSGAPLPGLDGCLVRALRRVRSRTPPDTGEAAVSFSINFTPGSPQ